MTIFSRNKPQERWNLAQNAEKSFWDNLILKEEEELQWKKKLIPQINFSDKVILDISCGPRGVIHYINEAKQKIGVDPLMDFYKEKYVLDSKAVYIKGVCENLPISSGLIDVVFCINVLDHVQSPNLCLEEICRVMKEDGLFVFELNVYPLPIYILKILRENFNLNKDIAHPHTFTLFTIKRALKKFFKIKKYYKVKTYYKARILKTKSTYLFMLQKYANPNKKNI